MGIETSRACELPPNIDSLESEIRDKWRTTHLQDKNNTSQQLGLATLEKDISIVANIIHIFLVKHDIGDLNILEVMAGNCSASSTIQSDIGYRVKSWIRTDIGNYSNKSIQMDSIAAVETYGDAADLLLIVSPPPGKLDSKDGISYYGDYFACKKFIEKKKESKKYIIIVGELGASDGSEGMYLYMLEHPKLVLIARKLIREGLIDMFGGPIEKEVFLFSIV